jgi:hypothetical protein
MARTLVAAILVCAFFAGGGAVRAQRGQVPGGSQAVLRQDVQRMSAGLGGPRVPPRQAIADVQRLTLGYRSLGPLVGGFGPADYAVNRALARQSLLWLGRTSTWYMHDPIAARAYLDAYDSIGLFYRDARFYSPAAYVAYAGAARLARRLMLGASYDWSVRELDRMALAYGTLVTLDGRLVGRWGQPEDLPEDAPPATQAAAVLKPVELPKIDTSGLSAAEREAWDDVRVRFRSVAGNVHNARVLLDQLGDRLRSQRLELHPANAATAMKMQGFVEDAAELIASREFETATEALRRADYERARLKGATGQ